MKSIASSTLTRRCTLSVCCAAHCIQDGLGAALYVLLPIVARTFGLSYAEVGVVRAISSTATALMELPSGVLSERFGERILIAFGLGAAGLGFFFLSNSTGVITLSALLFVAGVGGAFQHSLCSTLVTRIYSTGGRRGALGTYNAFGDIGKLLFTGALGLAIGIGMAWQQTVTGFGSVAIAAALTLFLILKTIRVGARPAISIEIDTGRGQEGWGIRHRRSFIGLSAIIFLDGAVQAGFLTFIAFFMTERAAPDGLAALAIILTLAGGIVGKYFCGHLADRIGVVRSLVITQLVSAGGIVVVLYAPITAAYVLLPVLGIFLQGSSSITYGHVGDVFSETRQSRGFALIYSVSNAASIAGPVLFGLIGDYWRLVPAMLTMAGFSLVSIGFCVMLKQDTPSKHRP